MQNGSIWIHKKRANKVVYFGGDGMKVLGRVSDEVRK
jgi:hypothetical protein